MSQQFHKQQQRQQQQHFWLDDDYHYLNTVHNDNGRNTPSDFTASPLSPQESLDSYDDYESYSPHKSHSPYSPLSVSYSAYSPLATLSGAQHLPDQCTHHNGHSLPVHHQHFVPLGGHSWPPSLSLAIPPTYGNININTALSSSLSDSSHPYTHSHSVSYSHPQSSSSSCPAPLQLLCMPLSSNPNSDIIDSNNTSIAPSQTILYKPQSAHVASLPLSHASSSYHIFSPTSASSSTTNPVPVPELESELETDFETETETEAEAETPIEIHAPRPTRPIQIPQDALEKLLDETTRKGKDAFVLGGQEQGRACYGHEREHGYGYKDYDMDLDYGMLDEHSVYEESGFVGGHHHHHHANHNHWVPVPAHTQVQVPTQAQVSACWTDMEYCL